MYTLVLTYHWSYRELCVNNGSHTNTCINHTVTVLMYVQVHMYGTGISYNGSLGLFEVEPPSCEPRHVCFGCRKNRRSQALCQHPLSLPGTEDITRITTLLARSCTLPGMVYLLRASSFLNLTSGCVPSSSEGSTSS